MLRKKNKNIQIFQLKIVIFYSCKNRCILHRHVIVIILAQEYLVVRSAEYALVCHEAREVCEPATGSSKKCEDYNIGHIILKDSHMGEEDRTALQLQFYIILTSSQKMFPHTTLENLQLRSKILSTSISGRDFTIHFCPFITLINVTQLWLLYGQAISPKRLQ